MQIILSRKGFDSSAGGIPSPIMPDGSLLPLPIPQADGPVKFSQLQFQDKPLSRLIKQLGGKDWRGRCHLDPDLMPDLLIRPDGWYPTLGQHGIAQRHLETENVGAGDLFLFFSWFRQTHWHKGKLCFVPDAPDLHLIYGWLQIAQVVKSDDLTLERWPELGDHPHLHKAFEHNALYQPTNKLILNGRETEISGAGFIPSIPLENTIGIPPIQQLTWPNEKRTLWKLPECLWPENCHKVLSYHRKPERWFEKEGTLALQSAYRGQEFVLESQQNKLLELWLNKLLAADKAVELL